MISRREEEYIREKAYVPEHVIPLMVGISQAEPFILEDYLFFRKDDGLILIGYPLGGTFQEDAFADFLQKIRQEFEPAFLSFIAPAIPGDLEGDLRERETDEYYRLNLPQPAIKPGLRREVGKAALALRVETSRAWLPEHAALTREFLQEANLPPRVRELYLRMPALLAYSETSLVLSARDKEEDLAAFFVVESGAARFSVYVVGCHSHRKYTPHASDLLFQEMIRAAAGQKKEYLHLGLGVNEGIRRFKRKWGGIPSLHYEFGEIRQAAAGPLSWLKALQKRL